MITKKKQSYQLERGDGVRNRRKLEGWDLKRMTIEKEFKVGVFILGDCEEEMHGIKLWAKPSLFK